MTGVDRHDRGLAERVAALNLEEANAESNGRRTLDLLVWLAELAPDNSAEAFTAPTEVEYLPSPKLVGHFRLEALLGRGAYGAVFRAYDTALCRNVALKIAWPAVMFSATASRRFVEEPKIAAALEHRGIVKIYDYGWLDAVCYIAFELIEGPTLEQWLKTQDSPDIRIVVELMQKVASAVHFAHERGIVHRDLKPSNILLRRGQDDSVDFEPLVTDFGLARRPDASELSVATLTGVVLGTDFYMSPEQAAGGAEVGPRSDVFSLGLLLYQAVTGHRPFDANTSEQVRYNIQHENAQPIRHWRRGIPRDLVTIINHCLEKSPERRYASAKELSVDLGHFLGGEPINARPPAIWQRGWKYLRRNPILISLMILGLLGLAGVLGWLNDRDRSTRQIAEANEATAVAAALGREHQYAATIQKAADALHRSGRREVMAFLEESRSFARDPVHCGIEWDYLWARANDADATLHAHPQGVRAVRFSPGGDLLASGGKDGRVNLWDAATRMKRQVLHFSESSEVSTIEFSADGSLLAVGGEDGRVVVYRIDSGTVVFDEPIVDGRVFSLAWLGENQEVAVGGDGSVLSVIDPISGRRRQKSLTASEASRAQSPGHPEEISALAYLPNRNVIAVFVTPPTTYLIDAASLDIVTPSLDGDARAGAICQVPVDKGYLVTTDFPKLIQVRKTDDWSKAGEFTLPGHVQSLRYSRVEGSLVAACRDGTIQVFSFMDIIEGRTPTVQRLCGHSGRAVTCDASPDGKWLASGGWDGEVKLWHHPSGLAPFDVPTEGDPIVTKFSPCGRWLMIVEMFDDRPGRVVVFDARTGEKIWTAKCQLRPEQGLWVVKGYFAFDPTGDELAMFNAELSICGHDIRTGKPTVSYAAESTERMVKFCYSSDSKWFIMRRAYGDTVVMDRGPDAVARSLPNSYLGVLSTIRGHLWVEMNGTHQLVLRPSPDAPPSMTLDGLAERTETVATSQDGRYLAAGGTERVIYLWDLEHPSRPVKFIGHEDQIVDLCFSSDGRTLLSHGHDGTVRFWDVASRAELVKLGSPDERIHSMSVHPSGRLLVLGVEHKGRFGLQIHRLGANRDSLPKTFDPNACQTIAGRQ